MEKYLLNLTLLLRLSRNVTGSGFIFIALLAALLCGANGTG